MYISLCSGSAINPGPPELGRRVERQICGSPLVDFLAVLGKIDDWFVHSYGRRS